MDPLVPLKTVEGTPHTISVTLLRFYYGRSVWQAKLLGVGLMPLASLFEFGLNCNTHIITLQTVGVPSTRVCPCACVCNYVCACVCACMFVRVSAWVFAGVRVSGYINGAA